MWNRIYGKTALLSVLFTVALSDSAFAGQKMGETGIAHFLSGNIPGESGHCRWTGGGRAPSPFSCQVTRRSYRLESASIPPSSPAIVAISASGSRGGI